MKLTFDPMTIEHLGFKMYSHLPNAVAELVANAFDADASRVTISITSSASDSVSVTDNGHGMSADDLQEKYLRIGRNRVKAGEPMSESGRRRAAGRKGLGKLALFGIGTQVEIRSKRKASDQTNVIKMDWNDMLAADGVYEPESWVEDAPFNHHGTTVTISSLKRKTHVNGEALAQSLARLFNYVDQDFELVVSVAGERDIPVSRELRYAGIEIESEWTVPNEVKLDDAPLIYSRLSGKIFASVKPLSQELRGITLYVNGRLANDPEFFGVSESSYAFSYLTGYIDADYLDDLPDDVIATDRRSISWELPGANELRELLQRLLLDVSRRRRDSRQQAKQARVEKALNINTERWKGSIRDSGRSEAVGAVLDALISSENEMSDANQQAIVAGLRTIAPEYADFHWRKLHPSLQEACERQYKSEHYLEAILEGIKRYVKDVRTLAGFPKDMKEVNVLQGAFSESNPKLDVIRRWITLGLTNDSEKNIRNGQREISVGLLGGFRNPIAHEEMRLLEAEGVFTYQDCLDALSILSHLRRRLDL